MSKVKRQVNNHHSQTASLADKPRDDLVDKGEYVSGPFLGPTRRELPPFLCDLRSDHGDSLHPLGWRRRGHGHKRFCTFDDLAQSGSQSSRPQG